MEKVAGGKGETGDQTVYCNALRTGFARKHLIKVSIRLRRPGNCGTFCGWVVVEATGMDVALF